MQLHQAQGLEHRHRPHRRTDPTNYIGGSFPGTRRRHRRAEIRDWTGSGLSFEGGRSVRGFWRRRSRQVLACVLHRASVRQNLPRSVYGRQRDRRRRHHQRRQASVRTAPASPPTRVAPTRATKDELRAPRQRPPRPPRRITPHANAKGGLGTALDCRLVDLRPRNLRLSVSGDHRRTSATSFSARSSLPRCSSTSRRRA